VTLRVGLGYGVRAVKGAGSAPFNYAGVAGYIADIGADSVTQGGGTVSAFTDLSGLANHFTCPSQPVHEAAGWVDGTASVLFNGTSNYAVCTTSLAASLVGGSDNSCTIYLVGQMVTDGATDAALIAFGSSSSNNPIVRLADNGAGTINFYKRDDSNAALTSSSATIGTTARRITLIYSGNTYTLRVDGVTVASGALDVGTTTVDRASIGALVRATAATFCNLRFKRYLAYTAEHSPIEYFNVEAALLADHF
jgi:hypothetical protein